MTALLEIKKYTAEHRTALAALFLAAFPDDPPWNAPTLMIADKLAHQPDGLLLGIDTSKHLVAAVIAGYDGHRGWINSLAVLPSARRRGYGKQMVDHAVSWLNDLGAVKVNLQIRGGNDGLRQYYEDLGFIEEPRISMGLLTAKGKQTSGE